MPMISILTTHTYNVIASGSHVSASMRRAVSYIGPLQLSYKPFLRHGSSGTPFQSIKLYSNNLGIPNACIKRALKSLGSRAPVVRLILALMLGLIRPGMAP